MFEWREDVIRPRLMLTRLCQGRVKVTEEEIKKGFEAYHGERLECRIILWPKEQKKFAMNEYARIRDSDEEFTRQAKSQPSPTLASQWGKIPVFGRNSLGDPELEKAAFDLHPGEITRLIETPQGHVVIKCDRRIPPDTNVKLEQERDRLVKEIHEKKVQIEMQVVFKELRDKANPKLFLKGTAQPEDLQAEAAKAMQGLPPLGSAPAAQKPPAR